MRWPLITFFQCMLRDNNIFFFTSIILCYVCDEQCAVILCCDTCYMMCCDICNVTYATLCLPSYIYYCMFLS